MVFKCVAAYMYINPATGERVVTGSRDVALVKKYRSTHIEGVKIRKWSVLVHRHG